MTSVAGETDSLVNNFSGMNRAMPLSVPPIRCRSELFSRTSPGLRTEYRPRGCGYPMKTVKMAYHAGIRSEPDASIGETAPTGDPAFDSVRGNGYLVVSDPSNRTSPSLCYRCLPVFRIFVEPDDTAPPAATG